MIDIQLLELLAIVVGPAGAAWVGVKTSVNGMRSDVKDIKRDIHEVRTGVARNSERLTAVETTLRDI